jgi:tripartite ATP-independent transporter DctM subunit
MSPEILGFVLLGALLTGIFVGFPIAFTLIILAIVFGYIGIGPQVFYLMYFQTIGLMGEETLAAVPLFVFMGHMLEQAGLMERLFKSFQFIFARVRGSLFLGVLMTATVFATATGIIGASVTVIGLLAAPTMMKSRYDVAMSAGVITAGGCLGILIPPSVMLVILGPVLGVSVVRLFIAAIVPGLILSSLFIGYTLIRCYINPKLGPRLPLELRPTSHLQVLREFFSGIVPLGMIIFASLGSIIAGLATPTEGAAMAATGSILLTAFYGKLNWTNLKGAALKTLQTSSMILFLAVASNIYGAVFARLGTATLITNSMLSLAVPPDGHACHPDGGDFYSRLAFRMAGHRPDLRPYILPRSTKVGFQPGVVRYPGGGEFADGLPLSSSSHGGILSQGCGPRMGFNQDLSGNDGVYDPAVCGPGASPLLPPACAVVAQLAF